MRLSIYKNCSINCWVFHHQSVDSKEECKDWRRHSWERDGILGKCVFKTLTWVVNSCLWRRNYCMILKNVNIILKPCFLRGPDCCQSDKQVSWWQVYIIVITKAIKTRWHWCMWKWLFGNDALFCQNVFIIDLHSHNFFFEVLQTAEREKFQQWWKHWSINKQWAVVSEYNHWLTSCRGIHLNLWWTQIF